MQANLSWLNENRQALVEDLAALVRIPSVSNDGRHPGEIRQTGELVCEQMRRAGLEGVELLTCKDSHPYAYGEWLHAGKDRPTVFLYAHHDVQPVHDEDVKAGRWHSDPWTLTERDGRLYGRGAADDKGGITAELAAVTSYLKTSGRLPVNVKMLVEGEEEIGSHNLLSFFRQFRDKIRSDVIVVCDTENIENGLPCITYALRGLVTLEVAVESAAKPVHSGMAGGFLADAAVALNVILARLYWGNGPLPIPGYYDQVRKPGPRETAAFASLPFDEAGLRQDLELSDSVRFSLETGSNYYEQTWCKPAVTVIAQEASSFAGASNQVLPRARALVSCRIVPNQEPDEVFQKMHDFLTKDPPWGVKVTVKPAAAFNKWWMTDPEGPAFEAARQAMKAGFGKETVAIGCGGTIGFVGPLAELFGGAPALLLGIEDPLSNAHAPDESLHAGDWFKLMASLSHLFHNLGALPGGKVK